MKMNPYELRWNKGGIVWYTHDVYGTFWGTWGVIIYERDGKWRLQIGRRLFLQEWDKPEIPYRIVMSEEKRQQLVALCEQKVQRGTMRWMNLYSTGAKKEYNLTDAEVRKGMGGWYVVWGEIFDSRKVKNGTFSTQGEGMDYWEKNWKKISQWAERKRKNGN